MPAATPLTSATTGVRDARRARTRSAPAYSVPPTAPSADSGAPEQNPRPAPVKAMTRTSGSSSKARTAADTASHICGSTALSRSGALRVIRPIGPAVSTITVLGVSIGPSNRTAQVWATAPDPTRASTSSAVKPWESRYAVVSAPTGRSGPGSPAGVADRRGPVRGTG